ncbi:MAG: hypothetical protein A2176_11820 [Spirochaetes bacterium RBG_13_51_14]|nr:MAG: hypothetical protein A2176_11820 [Spirochaetes bacterium RBG_13_51_14]
MIADKIHTGTILEIQRMSTEDGPGLRTTVFFKGCGLRCSWCHNPESLEKKPELQWIESRCIGCRTCLESCPRGALTFSESGIVINRDTCDGCGMCAGECPSTALEVLGKVWSVDKLVDEVIRDAPYFGASGGVTASGGEAALQAPVVAEFFRELNRRGIHTALDTSGHCPWKSLEMILPYADLVLYDIKEIDPLKHRKFTGAGNELILENLTRVAEYIREHVLPREMWIRTPIIPGATDRADNITGIGLWIAGNLDGVATRWELCAFNNLCRDKYRRLGKEWIFGGSRLMSRQTLDELTAAAKSSGVDQDIVFCTGTAGIQDAAVGAGQSRRDKKRTPPC